MKDDILKAPLPIVSAPDRGVPQDAGLGVGVDEEKLARYHDLYKGLGQFLPYDASRIGTNL